jgi:membrane-associated phospholipid phosphatase
MLASLSTLDHSLFWLVNSHHNGFLDSFFSIVTWFGTGWVVAPILLAVIFTRAPSKKRVSLIVFSSLVLAASGLINTQLKFFFHTPRPPAVFGRESGALSSDTARAFGDSVHVVGEKLTQNSFPSGHSNTAFATATLMMLSFGRSFWPAFIVACLVGYSRVYLGVHFPADVAGGGILGIIIVMAGFIIYTWIENRKTRNPWGKMRI